MSSLDDSSDDEDTRGFLRKALDVVLPDNFNPNSVPRDGKEYLHHVMYERNKCKRLVISDINPDHFQKNKTFTVNLKKPLNTNVKFKPSLEWQMKKLAGFKYFKQILDEHKIHSTIATFDEDKFLANCVKECPKYSTLQRYTHPAKVRMLELIGNDLSTMLFNDAVGAWVFGILVTLDIPLSPSSCYAIREFIRTCQHVRLKNADTINEQECAALNFYICICSRYFGQLDLTDS